MKTKYLLIIGIILMLNLVIAQNIKDYDKSNDKITIEDRFNKRLADFQLIYNSYSCSDKCVAIIKANINSEKSNILEKLTFKDIKKSRNKYIDYDIYIKEKTEFVIYNPSKKYSGDIYLKITGSKKWDEVIDWIPTFYGVDINEWAIWGNNYTYDIYPTTTINVSLWDAIITQTASGFAYINQTADTKIVSKAVASVGESGSTSLNSTNFTDYKNIQELGVRVNIYDGSPTATAIFRVFGNLILDSSAGKVDDSYWRLVRNGSNFEVYNDGVYNSTITPTSSRISLFLASTAGAGYNQYGELYIINYTYTNQTMSITQNTPTNNQILYHLENVTFNITSNETVDNLVNISLYIDNVLNETISISGGTNETIFTRNLSAIPLGTHNWSVRVCNDGVNCKNSSVYDFILSPFKENSQSFNSNTLSGNLETFTINITSPSVNSAILVYNNTNYSATSIDSLGSNIYIISTNFVTPTVTAQTNKTFYWTINVNGSQANSTSNNQSLNIFAIDDCSSYTNLILNYTIFDEINKSLITDANNPLTNTEVNIYSSDYLTLVATYNGSSSANNTRICLQNNLNDTIYYLDVITQYSGSSNYVPKFNYVQRQLLNASNIPLNIPLYTLLLVNSTEFTVTFKDDNFIKKPEVLVDVSRKYIDEGLFRSVEVAQTDGNGQTLIHLQLSDTIYTLTFKYLGEVLAIQDSVIAKCQNPLISQCEINVNQFASTVDIADFNYINGIALTQSINYSTNTITAMFVSQSGVNTVSLNVSRFDRFGNTTICSDILTSSSGTLNCIIPDTFGNSTVVSEIYSDGDLVSVNTYSLRDTNPDTTGSTIILAIMIIITLSMLFITDIRGILLGCFLGLILSGALLYVNQGNLFSIGSSISWLITVGVIILWKINKKEDG